MLVIIKLLLIELFCHKMSGATVTWKCNKEVIFLEIIANYMTETVSHAEIVVPVSDQLLEQFPKISNQFFVYWKNVSQLR